MSWIPLVLLVLRYLVLLFEALNNNQPTIMVLRTADGQVTALRCKVTKSKTKTAKITANYSATASPIIEAYIKIGRVRFAEAKFPDGKYLLAPGPQELGGEF